MQLYKCHLHEFLKVLGFFSTEHDSNQPVELQKLASVLSCALSTTSTGHILYRKRKPKNADQTVRMHIVRIWGATCQNQQSDCAPSEDSAQPGHPPSLIRVFVVRMKKSWVLSYPLSSQRFGGCPGWSESSLGAQSLCWFCHVAAHMA